MGAINSIISSNSQSVRVFKWNLKLDGSGKGLSVNSFLERLEEFRVSRKVTKADIYNSAVDLFQGSALVWYCSIKSSVSDFDSLVLALRRDFLPADHDKILWHEIKCRRQGAKERVLIFIAVLENLFSRLTVIPDEEKRVSYIKRNLLPSFVTALALIEVKTVEKLAELCRVIENANVINQQYRSPPNRSSDLMEPDLAYMSSSSYAGRSKASNSTSLSKHESTVAGIKCWNCSCLGHLREDCKESRRPIHCFGCGKEGITKNKCPQC